MSDADRAARAEARRSRGVTFERIALDTPAVLHAEDSVTDRLTAMTRLCRAAWLATGRPFPPSGREHRATMPGEVYIPSHVATRPA